MSKNEANIILSVKNLRARVEEREILKGLNLTVKAGEVHAIMGPNGAGKSTLGNVLAGRPGYQVTGGEVKFLGQDLLVMETEDRARAGLFLAFQYPVELPGVSNSAFLKEALNARRAYLGQDEVDALEFLKLVKSKMKLLEMDKSFLNRGVNEGFSGGEKKRNEILQMAMLEPRLALLDETDSGLDIDALRIVAEGVNAMRSQDRAIIVVTHYQRLLDYIVPDQVHVLADGELIRSGGKELALELEEKGYAWVDGYQGEAADSTGSRA
jgi:Fe-S cluster assembly ATP-binding protein